MFAAIYKSDEVKLMTLGKEILRLDDNKPAALLCLDHFFRNLSKETVLPSSDTQVLLMTSALCSYSDLVYEVLTVLEPWTRQSVQRLFSFTVRSGGLLCLPRGTFLHFSQWRPSDEDAVVEVKAFYHLYQSALRKRLQDKLEAYCNLCLNVRVFDPCMQVISGRRCDKIGCQRQHEVDHAWFEKRLRFHLFQILILDSLRFFGMEEGFNIRRFVICLSKCPLRFSCILKYLVRTSL